MNKITINSPDDLHLHIREGQFMKKVLPFSTKQMARAIIMPNLKKPIINTTLAKKYYQEILTAIPKEHSFMPLMTLYLNEAITKNEIKRIKDSQFIKAIKYYPKNVTTNSQHGVDEIKRLYPILGYMEKYSIPLLVHGETHDHVIDIFDREAHFIDTVLCDIYQQFPNLRIVLEHITTKQSVDFVLSCNDNVAATITPHHLLLNRNDLFSGGIRPHHYCLPIPKRKNPHQNALIKAATSGNKKFFLGTDSAPHEKHNKESSCGCAGIFTAHIAMELYTMVFEQQNALDKLEAFSSFYGADFYQLPRNTSKITLVKKQQTIPTIYFKDNYQLVPFFANKTINWQLLS